MEVTEVSSSENDSDSYDILCAFDSISFIEQEFINEGKQNGMKTVSKRSYADGYNIGETEGSKLGLELGFYHGFISHLQLSGKSHKAISKILKQMNKLSLSHRYLDENDAFIKASVQIIRSTFKSLVISMDLLPMFESVDVPHSIKEMLKVTASNNSESDTKPRMTCLFRD